jgi:4-aminobutyrate--pyruvate transaminase
MSLAKQITSAYMPLSAVLVGEDMYQAMLDESRKIGTFGHGNTYAGHPVSCAVANKTLEIYARDRVFEHVKTIVPHFWKRLDAFRDHPLVGEVRGHGFVAALELVADKKTRRNFGPKLGVCPRIVNFAQDEGLVVRAIVDTISICPPLIMTTDEIDEMFDRLGKALDRGEEWVRAQKLREA